MRRDLPTGIVTFLFTDIEGSTRLLGDLGSGYADALAEHRRVLREAFARHGGVEVDTQGDAFFCAFTESRTALAAAAEAQRALSLPVRIGIHTGEPQLTGEGYVGLDVHRAARICGVAHGGQVVLSAETRALLSEESNSLLLTDLGLHRLKDLAEPVRLFQLGEGEFPPLRSLNATNLPVQPNPLVGRERELEEVTALVRGDARLVTLTGPGGAGKTRLALQAAAESVDGFEDGVLWVPLAAVTDPDIIELVIAQTVGARNGLAAHVDEKRMLLLLDNLEQLLAAVSKLSDLLRRCPNLRLLVTSRALLRIAGEHEYRVDPLPEHDAVTLFKERAATNEPEEAVREICRRLDGLPLAIELAAARTRLLPPERLLERLDRALPVLTVGLRDAPERQRTLRAAIEWSYGLLEADERTLFSRLAVFAGSFTIEAAEEICEADLDTLESLLEKSLLRRWASGRLGMLETIHEYAAERLEASGEAEQIRRRHAEFFRALSESANLMNESEGEQRYDLVIPEQNNLRAALDWTERRDPMLGLSIAVALENYWATNSPVEGRRRFTDLLERAPDAAPELRALALRCRGSAVYITGDFEEGTRDYEESLAGFRRLGDEIRTGIMLFRLAVEANRTGDHAKARELLDESLGLHRGRFKKGEAQILTLLGHLAFEEGRHEEAFARLESSRQLCRESGFRWWEKNVLYSLADYALMLKRPREAFAPARDGLSIAHEIGDRQGVVGGLALLAWHAAQMSRPARAGRLWGAIDAEEERAGPVGQWEADREEYEGYARAGSSPEFDRGRAGGRAMSLDEAVEYAVSDD